MNVTPFGLIQKVATLEEFLETVTFPYLNLRFHSVRYTTFIKKIIFLDWPLIR